MEESEFSSPFVDKIIAYNKMENAKVITNENDISKTKFDVILAEPYFCSSFVTMTSFTNLEALCKL